MKVDHSQLLLIIAQSGRHLAQAAVHEGFTVRVADCFADIDTLAISEQYLQLPSFNALTPADWLQAIIRLSSHQPCTLICGTGIERFYPQLAQLPANIHFAGPAVSSFSALCDPRQWQALLDELKLPSPPTRFSPPQTEPATWLIKQAASWGGTHIGTAQAATHSVASYYQQKIAGRSASVLFLANGGSAHTLLLNEQFPRAPEHNDFCLQGISNELQLTLPQRNFLDNALQQLTRRLALQGMMSLDFIITDDARIYLLEINPRPTASAQLLDDNFQLISSHCTAVNGGLPPVSCELSAVKKLLWFCFAPEDIVIPAAFRWPEYCHDLPADGHTVRQGEVICSIVLSSVVNNSIDHNTGHQYANKLLQHLRQSA